MPRVTAATVVARTRTRRRKAATIATAAPVAYHSGGVLLIVPDETQTVDPAPRTRMATQQATTWDVLQSHPIAKDLEAEVQLALLCEFIDLRDELEGMSLSDYIDGYFAASEDDAPETSAEAPEAEAPEHAGPSANGDGGHVDPDARAEPRPKNLVGIRVVYRYPGRNVLSDAAGVTSDKDGVVEFIDVDGEPWTNVKRDKVFPIHPDNFRKLHVIPREAKEIKGWLEGGKQVKGQPEGGLLRSLFYELTERPECPDRIAFAIMNGKKPYVDRFVQLPGNGFEDDQKPTVNLFAEHCFRVQGKDYVIEVVTP
jgi:hypothetical protein